MNEDQSRAAAAAIAIERIAPGMTIGLGSGRAIFALVEVLGRVWNHKPPIRACAASPETARRALEVGIALIDLDSSVRLDIAVDGADEVDPDLQLIKGAGAALLREKFIIAASAHVVIMVDETKVVTRLGQKRLLPIEIVPFAWQTTQQRILAHTSKADRRVGPSGDPVVTANGNYLLDCAVPQLDDLHALAAAIKSTLGVVEHGLFLDEADEVIIGNNNGTTTLLSRA